MSKDEWIDSYDLELENPRLAKELKMREIIKAMDRADRRAKLKKKKAKK